MIINGGSRSNGSFFSRHLMRGDQNDRVEVIEIRGLTADNIRDAFREMKAVAGGTRCVNFFYHANVNTRDDERLSMEQWMFAADRLERELGLVDQPRFVVEHEKDGRTHRHIVWSRIDADSMTAISDSLTYPKHERVARELEAAFGHEPVESVLVKDRKGERPQRNPEDWEAFRGKGTGIDPKAMRAELTWLWQSADSGTAFAAALEDHGYILARGDRRDFCVIDQAGDEHSLGKRILGVKAAAVRERMGDIDREILPSVAEGRELAKLRYETSGDGEAAPAAVEVPTDPASGSADPLDVEHGKLVRSLQSGDAGPSKVLSEDQGAVGQSPLDAAHQQSISGAMADRAAFDAEETAKPGSRFGRVRAFWGSVREQFSDWRGQLQERVDQLKHYWERDHVQAKPSSELEPDL